MHKVTHIIEEQAILTDKNILVNVEKIQEGLLTETMFSSNLFSYLLFAFLIIMKIALFPYLKAKLCLENSRRTF